MISAAQIELLNAIPLPVFVVDHDVRIYEANDFAVSFFGLAKEQIRLRRSGEVLDCAHSHDHEEGCGRGPACKNCVIRGSAVKCSSGSRVKRARMTFDVVRGGAPKQLELFISATPFPQNERELALLVLEDITEISTLQEIIPICAKCKKIRDDQQYWHTVEQYFHRFIGVDFTHGMCPACMKQVYAGYVDEHGRPLVNPASLSVREK